MITMDFETRSLVTDLKAVGATRYATDTSTQALCLCWTYDDEEEVHRWHRGHPWIEKSPRPDELLYRIAEGELVEAHNAKFEYLIWLYALMREFPEFNIPLKVEQMRCSAAKASCLSMPRGLDEAAQAAGLVNRKDPEGKRLITKLSKPMRNGKFCEEEIEHRRNWDYCAQDVRTERELSKWCGEMTPTELEYWQMDFRMNLRGVNLDLIAAEAAIDLCKDEAKRLNDEMVSLSSGMCHGASKRGQFKDWINGELVKIGEEPLPDTQANTLSFRLFGVPTKAAEEARIAKKPEMDAFWQSKGEIGAICKRGMEISLEVNRSSVAKFRRMIESRCPDGRLHDMMLYNGADRTGRWSGQGVQPHNFVRGYAKNMPEVWEWLLTQDLDLIGLYDGQPLPMLAKACRGALIASDGCEMYAADFNAIEARKLAWMAGCASMLNLFRNPSPDTDIYCDMASGIYQREITKRDKAERQLGKGAVLGLGYAMGWEKFQYTVYMTEGIWLDDEFCQMVVNVYRKKKYPEVPKLWRAVENAAINAVIEGGEHFAGGDPDTGIGGISYFMNDRFLHCRLPSGRLLAYLDPVVKTKVSYRFSATNERGTDCAVTFPAPMGAMMWRVRKHAEYMAKLQKKTLRDEPPESFVGRHLSFMGRHIKTKKWCRIGTHGGSLVENADQASSRDLLAEAMLRVDRNPNFDLLLSIHDEVIAEAPKGTASVEEFEAIMSEVPLWATGMPVTAEGWIGPRLRK